MKKQAFTLAEVLITLGIIGVVAALTLPTLIANHRKRVVTTKLQKIYSVMNQAIQMSTVTNGEPSSWAKDCGMSGSITCTPDEAQAWFTEYIGKYLQISSIEQTEITMGGVNRPGFLVYLNDGIILFVHYYLYDINVYLDKKALQNSNNGSNKFMFRFNPILVGDQIEENLKYMNRNGFEPYATNWDGTRESLLNDNNYGCNKGGNYCSKLIQVDGWEIKDDYPIKL